jgi:hypothetical protein
MRSGTRAVSSSWCTRAYLGEVTACTRTAFVHEDSDVARRKKEAQRHRRDSTSRPDGRFLMIVPLAETAAPAPISIVVNWPATLHR